MRPQINLCQSISQSPLCKWQATANMGQIWRPSSLWTLTNSAQTTQPRFPKKKPPRNTRMPHEPSRTVERSALIKCLNWKRRMAILTANLNRVWQIWDHFFCIFFPKNLAKMPQIQSTTVRTMNDAANISAQDLVIAILHRAGKDLPKPCNIASAHSR